MVMFYSFLLVYQRVTGYHQTCRNLRCNKQTSSNMCMKTKYTVYDSHIELELESMGSPTSLINQHGNLTNSIYIYLYIYIYMYIYIYPNLIPIMNPWYPSSKQTIGAKKKASWHQWSHNWFMRIQPPLPWISPKKIFQVPHQIMVDIIYDLSSFI